MKTIYVVYAGKNFKIAEFVKARHANEFISEYSGKGKTLLNIKLGRK